MHHLCYLQPQVFLKTVIFHFYYFISIKASHHTAELPMRSEVLHLCTWILLTWIETIRSSHWEKIFLWHLVPPWFSWQEFEQRAISKVDSFSFHNTPSKCPNILQIIPNTMSFWELGFTYSPQDKDFWHLLIIKWGGKTALHNSHKVVNKNHILRL